MTTFDDDHKTDVLDPLTVVKTGKGFPFNFDTWKELNEKSPDEFEKLRTQVMEEFMKQASPEHQRRGRGLLFQIDAARRNPNTAINNCIDIFGMMKDRAYEPIDDSQDGVPLHEPKNTAKILTLQFTK